MTLSSILERVKKKGQVPIKPQPTSSSQNDTNNLKLPPSSTGQRVVDPVVAKLKEKRRLEKEEKERKARELKGLPPKKVKPAPKTVTKSTNTSTNRASTAKPGIRNGPISRQNTHNGAPNGTSNAPPAKKISFNDLMKRASKIDQSKLSISYQSKTKSPESKTKSPEATGVRAKPLGSSQRASSAPAELKKAVKVPQRPAPRNTNTASARDRKPNLPPPTTSRAPIPIRKPSSQLESKLKSKKARSTTSSHIGKDGQTNDDYNSYDDDNDSLDSFIESDDEEEELHRQKSAADYDRDEIWAIFNRGKKRSYYEQYDDYDSDSMEATGAEILEEENRSRRNAEIEDRRELEEERRRAAQKLARKNR